MSDDANGKTDHYIFHEIKITEKISLAVVQNLIQKYKDIQEKSDYKEIKHLIPKLLYTVLIERLDPGPNQTVRLYFSDIPEPSGNLYIRIPGEYINGIGYDIYTKVETTSSSAGQTPVESYSLKKNSLQTKDGSFNFLKCFFIPYLTDYRVLFVIPGQQLAHKKRQQKRQQKQQQKQKQKQYQSKQSKFKLTVPKGIKFLLNTKSLLQSQKVQEKHLIPGFKKNCPENITKNGNPLNPDQKNQIEKLQQQVAQQVAKMGTLCQNLIDKSTTSNSPSIRNSTTSFSSSLQNQLLHTQPKVSQQEYHQEALRLANDLERTDVVQCYQKRRKRQETQNLLQPVLPSKELVLVKGNGPTDIVENNVVLSSPGEK
jgi:hypothetical protein